VLDKPYIVLSQTSPLFELIEMNHTIKGIIIVAAIASMLVVGMNMFPLAQNTYASSHRHQDNIANQGDDTYRSPGSESSNVAIQESGNGNSATAFSDQSSNTQQQNQPTSLQQQDPQANKDKDKKFPITLNVLPNQTITNTNVNPNRNTASSNSSSASDASNDNTINNTALARQRQADASCAVAVSCPEGTTTVTLAPSTPPSATCVPPTVGGITATLTDDTCTAFSDGLSGTQRDEFAKECDGIRGSTLATNEVTGELRCTFPAT
jgi:hypothetical protein